LNFCGVVLFTARVAESGSRGAVTVTGPATDERRVVGGRAGKSADPESST
jgi:hypothetical protein